MRELKFRAWLPKLREMRYFGIWESSLVCGVHERVEIMQYTGLKDVRGDEIYEGDIIRSLPGNGLIRSETFTVVGEITTKGCFPFVVFPEIYVWDNNRCMVMGNKYESPGMLEWVKDEHEW